MTLHELIEEYTDCHDKERLSYLKTEIDRRVKDHILKSYDMQQ